MSAAPTEALVHPDGRLVYQGRTWRCALGRAGIIDPARKREGDGATPAALLPLRRIHYRAYRLAIPAARVPRSPIAPDDLWCDDPAHPAHPAYNRAVRRPFDASHEEMWRADALYDIVAGLGWNDAPVEPWRGSAIFLHVASPDYGPTAGCVALSTPDLLALLAGGLTALRVVQE